MKIDKSEIAPPVAKKPEKQTKVEFNLDEFVDKIL